MGTNLRHGVAPLGARDYHFSQDERTAILRAWRQCRKRIRDNIGRLREFSAALKQRDVYSRFDPDGMIEFIDLWVIASVTGDDDADTICSMGAALLPELIRAPQDARAYGIQAPTELDDITTRVRAAQAVAMNFAAMNAHIAPAGDVPRSRTFEHGGGGRGGGGGGLSGSRA